ncbi:ATP/GTP-binding protein [Streptomyces sp. ME02-6987-2C]|uniref:ATP/GTP-binding protein n=1 Tax=unclassified Streptomyces TaxID=2593676 RepID=UPI0029BAA977|nr:MULTISPECIES: ATP/GTP-binding protein [unclassified Streptomyces]MDX3370270.1 ATP/GTP-binding protein [Streptomyces sp. ME02-6987-2C]MDX3425822.1 ATP/GTP-binding protein [Streptomyces sp. ME02-6985-2c]
MEDPRHHSRTAGLLSAALGSALLALTLTPQSAQANPPTSGHCSGTGKWWVVCEAEDDTTTPGTSGQGVGGNDGGGSSTGNGSSGKPPACTYEKMEPQPPADSEYRLGHAADEKGAIFIRSCELTRDDGTGTMTDEQLVWVADGEEPPAVDPEAVAAIAVSKMELLGPDIASPRTAGRYTVGVPMWLWVDQTPTSYGPQTTSATAGAVTVTATARVSSIAWSMGDGSTVTCNGPGTPYKGSSDIAESPTCGHIYKASSAKAQSGKFTVTATSTWTVDWQGGGESGQFTEIRESDVQVAIGELQVVR